MGLTLTILFDDPFWVGLFESLNHDRLDIARVVFGSEPSDALVWEFVRERFRDVRFVGVPASDAAEPTRPRNPKRAQREAARAVSAGGLSTRSQRALQQAREATRTETAEQRRAARKADAAREFRLRCERRKARHRGR